MKVRTPHGIEQTDKQVIDGMVNTLANGGTLPVIHAVLSDGVLCALDGTHRIQAYHIAGITPDIDVVDYDDTDAQIDDMSVCEAYDYYHGSHGACGVDFNF